LSAQLGLLVPRVVGGLRKRVWIEIKSAGNDTHGNGFCVDQRIGVRLRFCDQKLLTFVDAKSDQTIQHRFTLPRIYEAPVRIIGASLSKLCEPPYGVCEEI
jgi:hypothetical protein